MAQAFDLRLLSQVIACHMMHIAVLVGWSGCAWRCMHKVPAGPGPPGRLCVQYCACMEGMGLLSAGRALHGPHVLLLEAAAGL